MTFVQELGWQRRARVERERGKQRDGTGGVRRDDARAVSMIVRGARVGVVHGTTAGIERPPVGVHGARREMRRSLIFASRAARAERQEVKREWDVG